MVFVFGEEKGERWVLKKLTVKSIWKFMKEPRISETLLKKRLLWPSNLPTFLRKMQIELGVEE